jgi:hypothetical protein
LRVEQLLHGYSDGHRLLAGSLDLTRTAKHLMLTLSDMSGRSMVPGFEEYVTAYPLPESDYYAYARTWYAPEMQRPGCVWTHTLLVSVTDLPHLSDLALLDPLFHRPFVRGFESYGDPLNVDLTICDTFRSNTLSRNDFASRLLSALYATPSAPVFVPVDAPRTLHELLLAIWNQQWPELRRQFAFCTGSIANRVIGETPLDLQLVPHSAMREIRREVARAVILELEASPDRSGLAEWTQEATADLFEPSSGDLRDFLRRFGSAMGGREGFAPLVQLKSCVAEANARGGALESLLDVILEHFPSPADARALKRATMGPHAKITAAMHPETDEADLLRIASLTVHGAALDVEDLEIESRARCLWRDNRYGAERLIDDLLRHDHNSLGERVLGSLVSSVPQEELGALFRGRPAMLISVVHRDPELATRASLWAGSRDWQRELFDAATAGRDLGNGLRDRIIAAMLEAGSDANAERAISRFGEPTIASVLSWWDAQESGGSRGVGAAWRRTLAQHSRAVLEWIVAPVPRSPRSLALAAQILDAHSPDVRSAGLTVWTKAVNEDSSLSNVERIGLHAFALALAFDLSDPSASVLASSAFEVVHGTLAADQLPYESWRLFEDHVPFLSPWRNWDKCERLRRGLVERFERYQWPVAQFILCAKRVDTLERLLETCARFKPQGRRLLQRMRQQADSLRATLPPESLRTFDRYV